MHIDKSGLKYGNMENKDALNRASSGEQNMEI